MRDNIRSEIKGIEEADKRACQGYIIKFAISME